MPRGQFTKAINYPTKRERPCRARADILRSAL